MRDRLSLRTILIAASLIAMVLLALVIWMGGKVIAFGRSRRAEQALESQGFFVQGRNSKNVEWSHFFRERDQFIVHVPGRRSPLLPLEWQHVNALGPLCELGLMGRECNSVACDDCLRRNKTTLRELSIFYCPLSAEMAAAIGECSELRSLVFRGVQDRDRFIIPPLPKLTSVRCKYATVSAKQLAWLADQPALERLEMSGPVSDEMIGRLLACKTLLDIDLGGTSISRDGINRLLAGLELRGITYSAVPLDPTDFTALIHSRVERVGLQHAKLLDSPLPLLTCERIRHLAISLKQFERLVEAGIDLKRENRLRLDVHGLTQYRDVPVNPWSSCVDLRRYDELGGFIGARIAVESEE